jgi:hypothetical protein
MANDVSANPWILDTVTAGIIPPCLTIRVHHMEFVDYNNDTDTCEVMSGDGKSLWKANGAADLQEVRSGEVGWVQSGLRVSQLSAGKIRIYVK